MKTIDLRLSAAELVKEYPELKEILTELGFENILNPAALKAMGNIMTLPRGAEIKGVSMEKILAVLAEHGFSVSGYSDEEKQKTAAGTDEPEGHNLPEGHPVCLMRAENAGLARLLDALPAFWEPCESGQENAAAAAETLLACVRGLRLHYAKKEEVLMPLLYAYGVTGPSQVMWDMDDGILKELGGLTRAVQENLADSKDGRKRIAELAQRIRVMIEKEERILFPLCLRFFTEEEWRQAYRDFGEMGIAFADAPAKWTEGEQWAAAKLAEEKEQEFLDGKVQLPTGKLTVRQLRAMLSLLPADITFIDESDRLRFFVNEGNIFPRPKSALGREVYNCHPPQIIPMVRNLIADFRAKKRDSLEVARCIMGRPVLVKYLAVYDEDGSYMGTVEVVQDCSHILEKFPLR